MPYEYDERPEGQRPETETGNTRTPRSGLRGASYEQGAAQLQPASQPRTWRDRLASSISSGWSATREWAGDTADWAGGRLQDGAEWAGETAEWAGQRIGEGAEWAGQRIDEGTEWAGQKIDEGVEWAQETASDVAEGASELWDGVSNTQIDVGLERASATMRMEEVRDWLMPAAVSAGLQLSEEDQQKTVTATYEYSTGVLTVESAALSISGANVAGFRTGPAQLTNVVAQLHNPDGGMPFFDNTWVQSATVELNVGALTAANVQYGEGAEAVGAESVSLEQMVINVQNAGDAMPLTGEASATTATFSVGRVALRGAFGPGIQVGSVDAEGTTASVNAADGTGQLGVDTLSVNGLASGETTLESASLRSVQAGLTEESASVTAGSASLSSLSTGTEFALGGAESQSLGVTYDRTAGTTQVSSDQLSISRLRADATQLESASGTGVNVGLGPNYSGQPDINASLATLDARGLNVDDQVTANQVTGSAVTVNSQGGVFDIGAETAGAQGLSIQQGTAETASASNLRVGVNANSGRTTVATDTLGLNGINSEYGTVRGIQSEGVTADIDGRNAAFDIGVQGMDVDQAASEYGSVQSGRIGALQVAHSDTTNRTDATVGTIGLRGVEGPYGQSATVDANGLSLAIRKEDGVRSTQVGLQSLSGTEMQTEYGAATSATMTDLNANVVGDSVTAGVGGVNAVGLQSQYGSASSATMSDVTANVVGDSVTAGAGGINAVGLQSQYGSADSVGLQGLEVQRRTEDGQPVSVVNLETATAAGLNSEYGTARTATANGLVVRQSGERTNAALTSAEVRDATGPQGSTLGYGRVDGVVAQRDPDFTFADVQRTRLQNLGLNTADVTANVGDVDLIGLRGSLRGQELDASLQRGVVDDVSGQFRNGQSIGIPTSGVPYVDMSQHQLDANLGLRNGTIRLGGGSAATIRDAASLVDSADVVGSVPMRAGDVEGLATIRPGTTLQAGVQVRDGRLVANRTGVRSNQPIDGPLWTTVKGAYLQEDRRGGRVMADVGGFFDQNITQELTGGLTGDESSRIPMEVGPLAQRLTRGQTEEEATGAVTLGRERETDNVVRVRSRASGLAAQFTRLLVASMRVQTANGEIQTGRTAVSSAQLTTTGTPNMPSVVDGSVGRIEVESLSTRQTLGAE